MPFDSANYQPIPEGHRRLLVLADFLETKVPRERFSLSVWANTTGDDINLCHTTACACGWGTTIPEFHALGFYLTPMGDSCTVDIGYDGRTGWGAVRSFFEITERAARFLFEATNYENRKDIDTVAARIRAFVAMKQAAPQTNEIGAVGSEAAA